jgi:hypothetical protein
VEKLTYKLYAINWRLVLTLTSLVAFAIAGTADEGGGY